MIVMSRDMTIIINNSLVELWLISPLMPFHFALPNQNLLPLLYYAIDNNVKWAILKSRKVFQNNYQKG